MTNVKFETVETQASYGIGLELGHQLKGGGLKDFLVPEAILAGIVDALAENAPAIEINLIHNALRELQERTESVRQDIAKQTSDRGQQFLMQNKQRPEVTTTASGLQYQVINMGTGARPTESDKVRIHYTGKNIDGQVFDSTEVRQQPIDVELNTVNIAGLKEALLMMPAGAKWQIYVPAEIGYGEQNGGAILPPNSALVFDLELLEIL